MIRSLLLLTLSLGTGLASAQEVTVLAPADLPPGARFGAAVSLSTCYWPSERTRIVAGAPGGNYGEQAVVPGRAYVFLDTDWSSAIRLHSPNARPGDLFGYSVHYDCPRFTGYLVGAPGEDAAYQFHRLVNDGEDYVTRLDGTAAGSGSGFGHAVVGMAGTLAAGAPLAEGGGAVLLFGVYSPPGVPDTVSPNAVLQPDHPEDRRFGAALAAGDGVVYGGYAQRLVVGAPGDGTGPGAVYVYRRHAQSWEVEQRIEGPPGFGSQVALGHRALAVLVPAQGGQPGRAYVYAQPSLGTWTHMETLDADPESPSHFGGSLWFYGVMEGGSWDWSLLVGAPGRPGDAPERPVFARSNPSGETLRGTLDVELPEASGEYGFAVAFSSPYWAVGDPLAEGAGRVAIGTSNVFPVGVNEEPVGSSSTALSHLAPNPVRASAAAQLYVPSSGPVRITAVDLLGRQAALLFEGVLAPGLHHVALDATSLPSGTYLLRVESLAGTETRRFTVLR